MFDRYFVSEALTCFIVSLFNDAFLIAYISCLMSKSSEFRKDNKWWCEEVVEDWPTGGCDVNRNRTVHYANGPDSSVGRATGYGLDGPGIEFWWKGEIIRTCPDRPWSPSSHLYNGYKVYPGVIDPPGRDADPLTPSRAVVKKE